MNRRTRALATALAATGLLWCVTAFDRPAIADDVPTSSPQRNGSSSEKPQRVIIHVNRHEEVNGFLALEDDDVIAVRTPDGEVETFVKHRILAIIRLVDPEPEQTGMVILRDGEVREGVIVEDAFDHVLMEIRGIRAKLKRSLVSHVVLHPTFEVRYAEYKAAIRPGMYDAHFSLCRWLVEQRRYELAQRELEELLKAVEIPEARKLLTLVNAQIALQQRPATRETDDAEIPFAENEPETEADGSSRNDNAEFPILSKEDVNLIRVYEIDFDHPPKVTITPDTVRAIIENYGTDKMVPASQTGRNAMFRAAARQPLEIVRLMFVLRARDLYPQIQVNSEPHSLNQFRQRVHDTWLINNCATTHCHGGTPGSAGGFYLHRRNSKDERVRYTNFLILERLSLDPEWPLINYDRPEDSLIIQYAMSPNDPTCRKPHPEVPGWAHAFSPSNARMKDDAVAWIRSMMQPRPEYPVDFWPHPAVPEEPRPAMPER